MALSEISISVIIPEYKETNIFTNLPKIEEYVSKVTNDYEIIVVDDGSPHVFFKQLLSVYKDNPRIIVLRNIHNIGKGAAIQHGVEYATKERVIFIDADLDISADQILGMITYHDDVVIGSKMHKDSRVDYPFKRRVMSLGYYWLIKMMFGLPVKDTQSGLKMFTKRALDSIMPYSIDRFAYDLEILVKLHNRGYTIAECPIIVNHSKKLGGVGARSVVTTFIDTVRVWINQLRGVN